MLLGKGGPERETIAENKIFMDVAEVAEFVKVPEDSH